MNVLQNMDMFWFYRNVLVPKEICNPCSIRQNEHGIQQIESVENVSSSRFKEKQEIVSAYHGSKWNVFHKRSLSDFPHGMHDDIIIYGKEDEDSNWSTNIVHSGTSTSRSTHQGKVDVLDRANSRGSHHNSNARPSSSGSRIPRIPMIPSHNKRHEIAKMPIPYQRGCRRLMKTVTDLEFYEIKGFMDLGFEFNQKELSPEVIRVVLGLKRIGRENLIPTSLVSRPYLSENWYMPRMHDVSQKLMKRELKGWAKAVAYLIQQES